MKTMFRIHFVLVFCTFILNACIPNSLTPETIDTALNPTWTPPSVTKTQLPPPTATVPVSTNTATATGTPIPTETPTPFVPKATIKIASQSPLSVQYADLGTDIMRGAELAVM